jgi:hypothetical protein
MPLDDYRGIAKALLAGLITAVGTALVIVPLFTLGLAGMPQPPSHAFAEALLGPAPAWAGWAFHLAYVTLVASAFLVAVDPRPAKWAIAAWSLGLWVMALVVFFPIVGWGVAGASVKASVAWGAVGPHLLFGVIFWAASRLVFARDAERHALRRPAPPAQG